MNNDLKPINYFLCVIGIALLSCVIILPPVFRVFFKEEPEEIIDIVPIMITECTNNNVVSDNYIDQVIITFKHQDNQVFSYNKQITRNYKDPLFYQDDKVSYARNATAFSDVTGYSYTVTPNDETSSLLIRENYELNSFQDMLLTLEGEDEPITLQSEYKLGDSMSLVQGTLVNASYVCENLQAK